MNANNIILTGFMGSGKTVVGLKLSERTGLKFIDIDAEIEKNENSTIDSIFNRKGEPYFRVIESKIIQEATASKNTVIATGGGSLMEPGSFINLKNSGTIIWLKADIETLKQRLVNSDNRPLLKESADMENLLNKRIEIYNQSDIIIDTSPLTVEQVVDKIIKKLNLKT